MSDFLLMLLPGAMYFWILFVGQGAMQEVLYDKETRVLPRILSCPVTPLEYIAAKMLRCGILCSVVLTLLLAVSSVLFGIKWGNPAFLLCVVAAWAYSMTGMLAMIFSLARTREQSNIIAPVVLLMSAMLGGSMFPFENLPPFMQMLGQCTPNRWAVLVLVGVAKAKPALEIIRPLVGLLVLGTAGCGLSIVLFQRQLRKGLT